ncbi:hypothetical protein OOT46_11950 [Aquabacterium sp. A7-Y]|uniref:hypothetical protein n=1 Tax=Aquabacterium sp. A7-Y TaxID=1349605 RepID=UPI00223DF641|nr:hypothetical protein [Aquabacterium sp. A7-Y]MCW7538555.1 hypothetical protein [Aquabacterium sp. A7-Y]
MSRSDPSHEGVDMRNPHLIATLLASCLALTLSPVSARTAGEDTAAGPSRVQVKMERDEFLRTHRWDDASATWVLKSGVEPPQGVKSRAEMKAERDEFLKGHRWDDRSSSWKPIGGSPPPTSTLSREQRRADTQRFMNTHRWDEQNQVWIERRSKTSQ